MTEQVMRTNFAKFLLDTIYEDLEEKSACSLEVLKIIGWENFQLTETEVRRIVSAVVEMVRAIGYWAEYSEIFDRLTVVPHE